MPAKKPEDIILKKSRDPEGLPEVRGFDFSKEFDLGRFLQSYATTGFQATNLAKAIDIVKEMRKREATIFLGYTSNMVSSGLREVIAYLAKNRMVDVLVTTAGGVEEDIIKGLKPFLIGEFAGDGASLRDRGINRIGNIFVPNDRYIAYEKLMDGFFRRMYEKAAKSNHTIGVSEFIHELGKETNDGNSIYHWATKNDIPVFCPPLTDGSTGDMLYFFKKKFPDFKIDISDDIVRINDIAIKAEKTGVIVLGGGPPKHHVINANLFREGADYAVYLSTGMEGDGSVAGATPEEGKSWGKVAAGARHVQVEGDATITFPLLVLGGFARA